MEESDVIDAIDELDAVEEAAELPSPAPAAAREFPDEEDEGVKAALAHLADIEIETAHLSEERNGEPGGPHSDEPGEEPEDDEAIDEEAEAVAADEAQPAEMAGEGPAEGASLSAEQRERPQRFLQQRSGDRRRRRGRGRGGERGDRPDRPQADRPQADRPQSDRLAETRPEAGREHREPREHHRDRHERPVQPLITDLLKEGQEILVQIAKEPLGQKGARITSHIALPGRYCVYMPTVEHTGVSRKISSDEERQRLKKILIHHKAGLPGGFIIRTAGEGRTEQEIAADIHYLYDTWLDIRSKAEKRRAPAVVYHDLDIVERTLRDQLSDEFKSIWCDSEDVYESVLSFVQRIMPALVNRVKMYTRDVPIFDAFQVTAELEKALRPKVWLKSGGYLVINQTEALVAIDINTGKFIGKSNRLEDTIVRTNIDAVKEIVRQIRLRDLGGIIVIDFIDMDERKNRQKVMQALEEAMRADRAPYKILQFNDFGLVAITRKRVKQSLERTLCQPCPACEGAGYVRSVQTVISDILIEARKIAAAVDGKECLLRVNPEVAKELKSTANTYVEEIEGILRRPVAVLADPLIHHEKFDLS
jgi:ribonuclease G